MVNTIRNKKSYHCSCIDFLFMNWLIKPIWSPWQTPIAIVIYCRWVAWLKEFKNRNIILHQLPYTIQFSFKELIGTDNGLLANMYTSPYVSICWLIARFIDDNCVFWQSGTLVQWTLKLVVFVASFLSANRKNFYTSQVWYKTVTNAEQWTVTSFLLSGRCKQAWMV